MGKAIGILAALLLPSAIFGLSRGGPRIAEPITVTVPAAQITFRAAGDFRIGTRVVAAPRAVIVAPPLTVMKFQVSRADYARCVADNACRAAQTLGPDKGYAVTGVSYLDAVAYAEWLSRVTGTHWRLPTDAEWWQAAGELAQDTDSDTTSADPSRRWLDTYQREAAASGPADPDLHPQGSQGINALGLADISGNVWEWTSSCFENVSLDEAGNTLTSNDYCGVRVVQGRHRSLMIDFVRDALSGGCSVGTPPDYLGFRLVRD